MAKKIILIFLFVLITPIFVLSAIPSDEYIRYAPHSENSNDVYSSSRFTQKDDLSTNTVKGIKLSFHFSQTTTRVSFSKVGVADLLSCVS